MNKIIIALLLGVIIGGSTILFLNNQKTQSLSTLIQPSPTGINNKQTQNNIVKNEISPTIVQPTKSNNPNLKTFTSDNLGITFTYLVSQQNDKTETQEIGNKVYIYSSKLQPIAGQFVEVFKKDKNKTLEEVIKEKFLKGYSENDCILKPGKYPQYPTSFVTMQITLPVSDNDDMNSLEQKSKKCPADYLSFGGVSYFLEDKNNPDKFVYFSIGQYVILSENNIGWQDTLRFLN